jgi:hypothetical protein
MAKKSSKLDNSFTVKMKIEKETKNTIRFEEDYDPKKEQPIIRTMYVPKHIAGDATALEVHVTMK